MKKRTYLVIVAIFFFLCSALTIIEGIKVHDRISLSDYVTPLRPDVYLVSLGIGMAFVTILFLIVNIFFKKDQIIMSSAMSIKDPTVIIAIGIFIIYVLLTDWIGFTLSSIIFYFVFLRWIGKYSYLMAIIISVFVSFCSYVVFVMGFDMDLPKGIIEKMLFGS
jgi:hypothetical protein